jgi:hypothetical protein
MLAFPAVAQEDLEEAKAQLKALSKSFILVRLKTNEMKIKALEARGYTEEAELEKSKLYLENKETILSFRKTFDFCPVYFFYSNTSDDIRKGILSGNVFDHNLALIEPELLQSEVYFTAEFTETENLGIHALVLMDHYLMPLKAPFPFFERKYIFFSLIQQGKGTIAKRYNKKLYSYYEKWFGVKL